MARPPGSLGVRKPAVTTAVRRSFIGRLGPDELRQILIAWLVLGVAFSTSHIFNLASFPIYLGISLVTVGVGFILHELAHKFTAQNYGCWAEFRLWTWGLMLALLLGFMTGGRFVFAAPGAVMIIPGAFGYGITSRQNGLIALAGPIANIVVAVLFLPLTGFPSLLHTVGMVGVQVNLWLAAFNMLPFGVLDGRKVFAWSRGVWALFTIPLWLLVLMPGLLRSIL